MNVFEVAARLFLDKSDYDKGLDDAEKGASSLGKGLKVAAGVGAAGMAALAGATVKVGKDLIENSKQVAEYGDHIDKMSQKIGISAEAYQEWDAVMQHSGTSIDSMLPSFKTMSNQAEKGSEAFQKLGISENEVANLSKEDLFGRVIEGLQGMEEGTERTAIASELLGRGATELGALLNTSAEDTQAMKDRVHELGGVLSDEAVSSAAAFQDQLQDMQTSFSGLKNNLIADFLPSLTSVMGGLTAIFSGDEEGGTNMISEGISSLVDNISNAVPKILEVGSSIVLALADAVIQNAPNLLTAAGSAIMTIGTGLIQHLPEILDSALQIVLALADGISQNLPTLIPAIVGVVLTIAEKLTAPDTLTNLIMAALQIIMAIGQGLIQSIPQLVPAVVDIVKNLATFLLDNMPIVLQAAADIGTNLITALWEAILKMASWIKEKLSGFFKGLFKSAKDDLEIHSPSKVWERGIGRPLALGIGEGIAKGMKAVEGQAEDAIGSLSDLMIGDAEDLSDEFNDAMDFGADIGSSGFDTGEDIFGESTMTVENRDQDQMLGMMADLLHLLRGGIDISNARDMREVSYA